MEKTKKRFNLVDLVVILAIVAVVAFVVLKLSAGSINSAKTATYEVIFYTEESTDYSLERIEVGDPVCDADHNYVLGEVTKEIVTGESELQLETADGRYVKAPREGYSSAYITFTGEGTDYAFGAKFDKGQYSVGQTASIRVGDSKIYGRIYDIKKIG